MSGDYGVEVLKKLLEDIEKTPEEEIRKQVEKADEEYQEMLKKRSSYGKL